MKDIIIIGAGGVGIETVMLIEDINNKKQVWNILGFVDDDTNLFIKDINGIRVLGPVDLLNSYQTEVYTVCTISSPGVKKTVLDRIHNPNVKFANLIHPSAIISKDCEMGVDIIVQANCIITVNVKLGNHIQINPQCGIGHQSIIKDFSSLYWNVNISGNVTVGEGCILGTKSTVIQGLNIGDNSIVGASANVIRDIPANCTVVGNPAKTIIKLPTPDEITKRAMNEAKKERLGI